MADRNRQVDAYMRPVRKDKNNNNHDAFIKNKKNLFHEMFSLGFF